MKFKKALITGFEKSELNAEILRRLSTFSKEVVFYPENGPEIKKHLAGADCLLVKFNAVSKKDIQKSPNLKYIGVMSTGFSKIDTEYASNKRITVSNVPGYSTESVAEFVFAVILEQIREHEKGKKQAREKNYSESDYVATEIKGKTFGILGAGRIGTRVAQLANCFGTNVIYWSRHKKRELEKSAIKYTSPELVTSKSDFLSLHFALTNETKRFLNKSRIAKIKKGALVINTAPMELVDIDALEGRLKNGDFTFILDHSDEMVQKDLARLSKYKNCIIYPPIAYISREARFAKQEILIKNIENFLKGKPSNVVN